MIRRGEASEQAICEAVIGLLAEVGYDRMSMDAVASRAHAGKATIYRRWPNKAALVTTSLLFCAGKLDHTTDSVPDTGSVRGDLLALGESKSTELPRELLDVLPGLLLAMRDDRQLADLVRGQLETDMRDVYGEILRRGVARGEIPPEADADLLVEVGFGMVLNRLIMQGKPLDQEFGEYLVDRVLLPLVHNPTPPSVPHQISTDTGISL